MRLSPRRFEQLKAVVQQQLTAVVYVCEVLEPMGRKREASSYMKCSSNRSLIEELQN